ncbi:DUF350 domain-containing protein [Bacillus sp. S13(2024)]|uniref:DUF350 domain-containing protein n=1 Tax=unclassified Bacillus (in: firmicutes) TaxID=185979 RepID=UPI003D1D2BEF
MNLFLDFFICAGTGLTLLYVGFLLFDLTTNRKELQLIAKGNVSAAMAMGGKLLGLTFIVGAAIAQSASLIDMILWSAIGIVIQIIAFYIIELVVIRFSIKKAIEEDNRAVGLMILLLSISMGWVLAQCLTY